MSDEGALERPGHGAPRAAGGPFWTRAGKRGSFFDLPRRIRDPRSLRSFAAVALVAAAATGGLWRLAGRADRAGSFPRLPEEFLAPARIESRLAGIAERLHADPQDLASLLESGKLHFQKGREFYPTAINQLEEARRLGALDPEVFYYLAVMYQEEGLYPFAIAEYQKFIRNFPEDREVRLLLAKLLYRNGRYEDAAVQYQSLQRNDRERDPIVQENLGLCLMGLKRWQEASEAFRPLLDDSERRRRARFHLGVAAFEDKRYADAREHFEELLPLEGQPELVGLAPAAVHAAVASNYEQLKQYGLAKTHWDKALEADPKNARAKAALRAIKPFLKKPAAAKKQPSKK